MSDAIPFDRLGIPSSLQPRVGPDAPVQPKLALARGLLPTTADVQIAICYALALDPNPDVADAARETLCTLPMKQLSGALSERTHPKILEYIVEFRPPEPELDSRLMRLRALNTRAARLIARRAPPPVCDDISRNHERLLMSPEVVVELHANPAATDAVVERALEFLKMEGDPPPLPPVRPFRAEAAEANEAALRAEKATTPVRLLDIDPEAEVEAALAGERSPALMEALGGGGSEAFTDRVIMDLGNFKHDFYDEADFEQLLLADLSEKGGASIEDKQSLVQLISKMSVVQKIKLAYLGNKEARAILIRDRIKSVPTAVIRSGRLTDAELITYAGDRNLPREVIRQFARSKECCRKYPVQAALCNNPKTPVQVSLGFLKNLTGKDLVNLTRNKNVSSVLAQAAIKLAKTRSP